MSERISFDVLIIGAGQAGIRLAHALAKAGKRVGLAERGLNEHRRALHSYQRCHTYSSNHGRGSAKRSIRSSKRNRSSSASDLNSKIGGFHRFNVRRSQD